MEVLASRKPRFLCLHGAQTNQEIMALQMATLQRSIGIDCVFLNAPFEMDPVLDPTIVRYFPDQTYYTWFKYDYSNLQAFKDCDPELEMSFNQSIELIIQTFYDKGPFDGIIGFSQGARMAVTACHRLDASTIKCLIIISGGTSLQQASVTFESNYPQNKITLPSLLIASRNDVWLQGTDFFEIFKSFFDESTTELLYHNEGHRVPSPKSELYPSIKEWIYKYI